MKRSVQEYYRGKESRYGYQFLLGGVRHFGYYPEGERQLTMREAQRCMESLLFECLDLSESSYVLDAGCGEGYVALEAAERKGWSVVGLDILPESINRSIVRKGRRKGDVSRRSRFLVGSFAKLPFQAETFDGVYTMESLVHAEDVGQALTELCRVLRPGGRGVFFEYSMPALGDVPKGPRDSLVKVCEQGAMPGWPQFEFNEVESTVEEAGFSSVEVRDITAAMLPMLRRFRTLAYIPHAIARFLGKEERIPNATAAVELFRHREFWRYNVIVAEKRTGQ